MESLISDELRAELGDNISILSSKRVKSSQSQLKRSVPAPLSTNAQKKLNRIEKTRAAKLIRGSILQSMKVNALSKSDIDLLRSSGRLGQNKDTKRGTARRTLLMNKAGLGTDKITKSIDTSNQPNSDCSSEDDYADIDERRSGVAPLVTETISVENGKSGAGLPSKQVPIAINPADIPVVHIGNRPKRRRVVLLDTTKENNTNRSCEIINTAPSLDNITFVENERLLPPPPPDIPSSDHCPVPSSGPVPIVADCVSETPVAPVSSLPQYVAVTRPAPIQSSRSQLPVFMEEQTIMESVHDHSAIIICGATGSGKTTQIPQFLYEGGYGSLPGRSGMIGITQPRRIAAIAMASRVANEMGNDGHRVGHQIRFESRCNSNTAIKFMTDGILLREIQSDFLLSQYSVIVLDEAHERNLNTDVLIGLLSRIIPLRNESMPESPLKLIIMSATLRVQDFAENVQLFPSGPPPIINIAARQYPVTVRFSRRTSNDYLKDAIEKVSRIHRRLPQGGILVFVTGKQDINYVVRVLRKRFNDKTERDITNLPLENDHDSEWGSGYDQIDRDADRMEDRRHDGDDDDDEEEEGVDSDMSDVDHDADGVPIPVPDGPCRPCHILPLHALLSPEDQVRVLAPLPSDDHRLIVISTNVAETSLTIPNIKYVVDTGREKVKVYDHKTGISSLKVSWISKASADQRSGRAGRTGPGHTYRLYSTAVYDQQFPDHGLAEIYNSPIEGTVLTLKAMGIESISQFPFPSPPSPDAISSSLQLLTRIGALNMAPPQSITRIGQHMSRLPLSPRYSRMMALSGQYGCQPYMISIVALLTVGQLYIGHDHPDPEQDDDHDNDDEREGGEQAKKASPSLRAARQRWADPVSDILGLMAIVLAYEYAHDQSQFCHDNCIRPRAMYEVGRLRRQLHSRIAPDQEYCPLVPPPSLEQRSALCQLICSGLCDQVARRHPDIPTAYQCLHTDQPVYIHPQSALFPRHHHPEILVYHDIIHTPSKVMINAITAIRPSHLYRICPHLCRLSPKPLASPLPVYSRSDDAISSWFSCSYGPLSWPLPHIAQVATLPSHNHRWFARLLLQGDVLPSWSAIRPLLSCRPSAMTQPEALSIPVLSFLRRLTPSISCLAKLKERWVKDPNFLLPETQALVQKSARPSLVGLWPSLIQ